MKPEEFNQLIDKLRDDAFRFMKAEKGSIEETLFGLSLAIRVTQVENEYAKLYKEVGEIKHENG